MVEHTFVDVELPPDPDEQDDELRTTLEDMGRDDWELVSVLPADTDEEDGRITVIRLFFKRTEKNTTPIIDQGVYERSGVTIPLPAKDCAAVVLYCPLSWSGTVIRWTRSRFLYGTNIMTKDSGPDVSATRRQTTYGLVCAAVWPELEVKSGSDRVSQTVHLEVKRWPQFALDDDMRSAGLRDKEEVEAELFGGAITEVDWRHKPEYPKPL